MARVLTATVTVAVTVVLLFVCALARDARADLLPEDDEPAPARAPEREDQEPASSCERVSLVVPFVALGVVIALIPRRFTGPRAAAARLTS